MSDIKTKQQQETLLLTLEAEYQILFPDNSTHEINPEDLRVFMQSQIDYLNVSLSSSNLQRPETEIVPGDIILTEADIDQNVRRVHTAAISTTMTLPPITPDLEDITITGVTTTSAPLTFAPTGGDTIRPLGFSAIADVGDYQITVINGEWIRTFTTRINTFAKLEDTPQNYTGSAGKRVGVNDSEFALEFADPSFAQGQFESVATTDILSGVYVDVNEPMVSGPASPDLTVDPTEIIYTGTLDKTFAVDVSVSAEKTSGTVQQYRWTVSVNDIPVGPAITATYANGNFGTTALNQILTLSTNDTVKVQVQGVGTADDIVVGDLMLRLIDIN